MKVEVEHVETGHAAIVTITTDTGAVVHIDVDNAWEDTGAPPRSANVYLHINGEKVFEVTPTPRRR